MSKVTVSRIVSKLAEKKVNVVIAGKLGGNMESALKEKGIECKEESGKKVKEVIK